MMARSLPRGSARYSIVITISKCGVFRAIILPNDSYQRASAGRWYLLCRRGRCNQSRRDNGAVNKVRRNGVFMLCQVANSFILPNDNITHTFCLSIPIRVRERNYVNGRRALMVRRSTRIAVSTSLYLLTPYGVLTRFQESVSSAVDRPIFRRLLYLFRVNAMNRGVSVQDDICFPRVLAT